MTCERSLLIEILNNVSVMLSLFNSPEIERPGDVNHVQIQGL